MSAPHVVTLGETMAMMRSGVIGSLAHLPHLDVSIGGAESNLAIGLQRLEVPTAWLGRVGDDPLGERVAREIRAEGVETHALVDPDRPTGLMIKSRPSASTTQVDYYRSGSAGSALAPEDIPPGFIESARILHVTGITPLLSDSARRTVVAAVERAQRAGVLVSLDVNHRSRLGDVDRQREVLEAVVPAAGLIFGGAEELDIVAGMPSGFTPPAADASNDARCDGDERQLLESLAGDDGREIVLKLGAEGAAALVGGEFFALAGRRVEAVDTVGAGDAFVAGYLSAVLDGLDGTGRLERANICGAAACTTPGDWEGAPRRRELGQLTGATSADPVRR